MNGSSFDSTYGINTSSNVNYKRGDRGGLGASPTASEQKKTIDTLMKGLVHADNELMEAQKKLKTHQRESKMKIYLFLCCLLFPLLSFISFSLSTFFIYSSCRSYLCILPCYTVGSRGQSTKRLVSSHDLHEPSDAGINYAPTRMEGTDRSPFKIRQPPVETIRSPPRRAYHPTSSSSPAVNTPQEHSYSLGTVGAGVGSLRVKPSYPPTASSSSSSRQEQGGVRLGVYSEQPAKSYLAESSERQSSMTSMRRNMGV